MPVQFDNYDQAKIERLKNHLVIMAGKNQPKPFEIYVDGMKAVPKTEEPSEFDGYENFLTEDSERIKICIYNSPASNNKDQYVFVMKARNRQEAMEAAMNGFESGGFGLTPRNLLEQAKKDFATEQLRLDKQAVEKRLGEAEEYIKDLEQKLAEEKENGKKIGGIHMGELLSVALEGIARRNTHLIAKIPGAEGLAGIIDKDNHNRSNPQQPEGEASFKKKSQQPLNEQEQALQSLMAHLQHSFNSEELDQMMLIIDNLANDKTQLPVVADLLQNAGEEEEQETNH